MSTLFAVITWPFRAMLALFLIVTMPMWRSSVPFIEANERIDGWLWRHLGPIGAFMMLAVPFVWLPLFLIFWTWVYGLLFYWPAELLLNILPTWGDLADDLKMVMAKWDLMYFRFYILNPTTGFGESPWKLLTS